MGLEQEIIEMAQREISFVGDFGNPVFAVDKNTGKMVDPDGMGLYRFFKKVVSGEFFKSPEVPQKIEYLIPEEMMMKLDEYTLRGLNTFVSERIEKLPKDGKNKFTIDGGKTWT